MLIFREDGRGYYFANVINNGKGVVLNDGTDITGQEIIGATKNNVKAVMSGYDPISWPESIYRLPVPLDTIKGEDALSMLKRHGYTIDEDMHIYKRMGRPFSNLKSGHAKAIVATHLLVCNQKGLNPEQIPVTLCWRVDMKENDVAMLVDGRPALIPNVDEGYIGLCKDGKIGLVYNGWEIIPHDAYTITMRQNVSATPVLIHSMQEFNKGNHFITNEGYLLKLGENKLEALTLSIDDFI